MVRPRLPPDLLDRSAEESSRLLALSYLDQIDDAHQRLSDSLEQEALHHFRVGLRRLRSSLRAYRPQLRGSVTGKMRRQVGELTRSTNEGRDTEVQLSWLRAQTEHLAASDVPGVFWFRGRLEGRKQESHDPDTVRVARRYLKVAQKFRRALGVLRIELENGRGAPLAKFGEVTGTLTREQVIQLRDALTRIQGEFDVDGAHRARIAVKRLRYLVEPIARRNRRAGALIRQLKEAQDLLGEHHDMHVLSAEIASLRSSLSSTAPSELEPGLTAVVRLADGAAAAAFQRFQSLWGGQQAERIFTRADELGRSLEQPHSPQVNQAPPSPAEKPISGSAEASLQQPARVEVEHPLALEPR
jgi:CHAD domain-containing protein